eukprot:5816301-Alexandrium_andersonii.AAC.1
MNRNRGCESNTPEQETYEAREMGAAPQHSPGHAPTSADGSAAAALPKEREPCCRADVARRRPAVQQGGPRVCAERAHLPSSRCAAATRASSAGL